MSSTPANRRRVVLDTDTYNEVDDQFALAHLLLSPDQLQLEAIYAAPFLNNRSVSPEDGMEKSYEEIGRVLELVPTKTQPPVFRGSKRFLTEPNGVVESDTVTDLIERALGSGDEKLYVLAIGAPTNVASALNAEPKIAEKIVIVWLGGHAPYWHNTGEFNLKQDLHSSRVLLNSKAPLILLPCNPVTSHLLVTVHELEAELAPFSKLGKYLTGCVRDYIAGYQGLSKVIWDIAASAWAINPAWVKSATAPSPVLLDNLTWDASPQPGRHSIEIARSLDRDVIFKDFFAKAKNSAA